MPIQALKFERIYRIAIFQWSIMVGLRYRRRRRRGRRTGQSKMRHVTTTPERLAQKMLATRKRKSPAKSCLGGSVVLPDRPLDERGEAIYWLALLLYLSTDIGAHLEEFEQVILLAT